MIVEEKTVRVDVVEPPLVRVTLAGENDAVMPLEKDPDNEIVPANPCVLVRVTVEVEELDVCSVRLVGLEEIVKSAGTTLTVTGAT